MTGIKHYSTASKGIGGDIKKRIADFIVREITFEGKTLETKAFGEWPEKRNQELIVPQNNGEEYLHVEMEKFNLDTNDALRRVARHLHCSPKRLGYAGMKDKRAITVQLISIWKPEAKALEAFNQRYVSLTNAHWSNERMEIGKLKGNDFEITIRNISMEKKELGKNAEKFFAEAEKNGIANYFGEQRFGGAREITHKVGKKFIDGKFEEAIMLYLTSPSTEEEEIAIARKNLLETRDFARATKEFPAKFRFERAILHHLCKYPKDFVGAFQKLPRHLTYLFTHAYQSYLFNQIINRRMETGLGLQPVEGDTVEDGIAMAPLMGFDTEFAKGKPGEIEKRVMEEEGVKLEDFRVKSFMELSCSGARKKILVKPLNPRIILVSEDELNEGKLKLKTGFSLEKGNYATTVLRELMKS
ncbi:MAG: tRNA pseudouridine(13) synthase TruD [archaeon]